MSYMRPHYEFLRFTATPSLLALGLLATHAAAQDVKVLDAVNGPYFTLQAALDAASSGDIILVEPGLHVSGTAPMIDGKSISILAVDSSQPTRIGPIRVQNLSSEDDVVFRGISFTRYLTAPNFTTNATILSNAGTVSFDGCSFVDGLVTGQGTARPAVELVGGGGDVMFTRCSVLGADGLPSIGLGVPGLGAGVAISAVDQNVYMFGSDVIGGRGGESLPGADAILVDGASVYVTGGSVVGGIGGWTSTSSSCSDGGDGGDGIAGSAVTIELFDATDLGAAANILGGAGGASQNGNCAPGAAGQGISATGSVLYHGGFLTSTSSDVGVVEAGDDVTMIFEGPAFAGGSAWFLRVSPGIEPLALPPVGIEVLPAPVQLGVYAFTGPSGSVSITSYLDPAGTNEGSVIAVQSFHFNPNAPNAYLGAYTHVAVVRPGFDPL